MPRKTTVPGRKPGRPAGSVAAARLAPKAPSLTQSSPATNTVIAAMTEYGHQLQQGVDFFQKLIDGYATLEAMVRASNSTTASPKVPDTSAMTTKELRQLVNECDLDVELDDYDDIGEKREVVANAFATAAKRAAHPKYGAGKITDQDNPEDLDGDLDFEGSVNVDFSKMSETALKQFVDDHELDLIDVDSYDDVEDL